MPAVEPVLDLPQLPPVGPGDSEVELLFYEKALADHGFGGYLSAGPRRVAIAISVLPGPNVLRTDTAAIYAIAAVQSVYRELAAWKL